jgi:hypothetical protein
MHASGTLTGQFSNASGTIVKGFSKFNMLEVVMVLEEVVVYHGLEVVFNVTTTGELYHGLDIQSTQCYTMGWILDRGLNNWQIRNLPT